MNDQAFIWVLVAVAILGANLPWLSDRIFFFLTPKSGKKHFWFRFLEWFVLYFIVGGVGLGIEYKLNGSVYSQDWEFYIVTFFLFLIFALPGFIYHFEFNKRPNNT